MKRNFYNRVGGLIILSLALTTFLSLEQEKEDPVVHVTEVAAKKKYDKKPKTAIKVGTVPNEYEYLAQLCGPNGESIQYKRLRSCCPFDCPSAPLGQGLLDEWEITVKDSSKSLIVYLNGYEYDNPRAPKGLGIKSSFKN